MHPSKERGAPLPRATAGSLELACIARRIVHATVLMTRRHGALETSLAGTSDRLISLRWSSPALCVCNAPVRAFGFFRARPTVRWKSLPAGAHERWTFFVGTKRVWHFFSRPAYARGFLWTPPLRVGKFASGQKRTFDFLQGTQRAPHF